MKLMTALVNVALGVSLHKENNQRQYDAEQGKGPGRRTANRLETLLEQRKQVSNGREALAAWDGLGGWWLGWQGWVIEAEPYMWLGRHEG